MNKIILSTAFLISVLFFVDVSCDEATDLKLANEKFVEAKQVLADIIARMKSDYIKNFATVLAKGVVDLEEKTQNELKVEKDATKRKVVIDFATKAYERLIKFIKEIEQNLPNSF